MIAGPVLVANRGEIAVRILRTARALGLGTVAVFTDADAGAPHVAIADRAVRIGQGPARESYLSAAAILAAARVTGARALHPGCGFLSESADFAAAVAETGLAWIGPPPAAMRALGDKAAARRHARAAGIPCLPGHDGPDLTDAALLAAAGGIGFPVMVKAVAGGGGRGMRLVRSPDALRAALGEARAEALAAFGSGALLVERALDGVRHVEVQVIADRHGTCLALGDRDCSVQRRHQKLIEEAPAPGLTPAARLAMADAAVRLAQAAGYEGAGTVEFLLDAAGNFFFLEMNTRLQVEHGVTEAVTGLDLVALQFRVASGAPLGLRQDEVRTEGHAIEARLCAEDPAAGFLPQTGRILGWRPPAGAGIRVDAGIAAGLDVPPFYDSLLGKIIAHGPDRETARRRLAAALHETLLIGPATNRAFLIAALAAPGFARGVATTAFLGEAFPHGFAPAPPEPEDAAIAAALLLEAGRDAALARAGFVAPALLGWSSAAPLTHAVTLACGGLSFDLCARAKPGGWEIQAGDRTFRVTVLSRACGRAVLGLGDFRRAVDFAVAGDGTLALSRDGQVLRFTPASGTETPDDALSGRVTAPMPGLLAELHVTEGARVAAGDRIAVMEAMKMRHPLLSPVSGRIAALPFAAGAQVAAGALIAEIAEDGNG